MKINWRRQHKLSSLELCFLLLTMCLSGVVLNHRDLVRDYGVSRVLLPHYRHSNWNGGLLRGSLPAADSSVIVLLYGTSGIYRLEGNNVTDFNTGLPAAPALRAVRAMTATADGRIYAVTSDSLYRLTAGHWQAVSLPSDGIGQLSDLTSQGDSVVVVGRSGIGLSPSAEAPFNRVVLQAPADGTPNPTGFRAMWLLHSGKLFGPAGVAVADIVAIVLTVLIITGLLIWLLPKAIKKSRENRERLKRLGSALRNNIKAHRLIGVYTLVLTMLVCITGFCLRPPLLIPLALSRVPEIPGTTLADDNPWNDRLRMLRHDPAMGWLLSTSDGFYCLDSLTSTPKLLPPFNQPPVSVMGLNVFHPIGDGDWLVGSFNGLYRWSPSTGNVFDATSNALVDPTVRRPPFGKSPVAGLLIKPDGLLHPVDYDKGTAVLPQPDALSTLPMPLWNLALETHTGRLWMGNIATWIYIPLISCLLFWCLLSGYKSSRRPKKTPTD